MFYSYVTGKKYYSDSEVNITTINDSFKFTIHQSKSKIRTFDELKATFTLENISQDTIRFDSTDYIFDIVTTYNSSATFNPENTLELISYSLNKGMKLERPYHPVFDFTEAELNLQTISKDTNGLKPGKYNVIVSYTINTFEGVTLHDKQEFKFTVVSNFSKKILTIYDFFTNF